MRKFVLITLYAIILSINFVGWLAKDYVEMPANFNLIWIPLESLVMSIGFAIAMITGLLVFPIAGSLSMLLNPLISNETTMIVVYGLLGLWLIERLYKKHMQQQNLAFLVFSVTFTLLKLPFDYYWTIRDNKIEQKLLKSDALDGLFVAAYSSFAVLACVIITLGMISLVRIIPLKRQG